MTDHRVGNYTFGPTQSATSAARRLSALAPLSDVESAMSALERGRAVAARKAVDTQKNLTVIDQLRTDSRTRRMKNGA
jgi:hypothetical protein